MKEIETLKHLENPTLAFKVSKIMGARRNNILRDAAVSSEYITTLRSYSPSIESSPRLMRMVSPDGTLSGVISRENLYTLPHFRRPLH
jgi:hypothetical protein